MNFQYLIQAICLLSIVHISSTQRVAPGVPPQKYQPPSGQNFQHQQQRPAGVAPGVPPQKYQPNQAQPNVAQQQQQQGGTQYQQQGQVPVQQQQQHVPVQQHQQQVPVQQQQHQVPVQQQVPVPVQQVQPPSPQVPPPAQQQQQAQVPPQLQQGVAAVSQEGQKLLDASNIGLERAHIQEHLEVPEDTSKMTENELLFHYFKMHDTDSNGKLDGCELVKSVMHWQHDDHHEEAGGETPPKFITFTDDDLAKIVDPILKSDDKNGDGVIDYAEFNEAQMRLRNDGQRTG